ncbi:TonB-dependent receptor plug domain-containing protein [Massilia sp. B-10]|nr:TonB-dependent receptor plug domain-containing protein [Massilia sp. B-10]
MKSSAVTPFRRPSAQIQLAILTLLASVNAAHAQSAAPSRRQGSRQDRLGPDPRSRRHRDQAHHQPAKTPIAITSLNAATLQDNHVQTMLDVVSLVPGFQATAQGDHGVTTMTLRGIGNDSAKTQYADPEVASFVDNVYSPRAEGATALMFDIEAIEVLRGPQGTLWGCNSTVGAVNIQTVKPELNSRSGSVEGGIGDYNRYGARAAFNMPLSDTAALRIGVVHEQHDGYVDYQKFRGVPIADQQTAFVAVSGDIANFRPINGNQFAVGNQKYSAQNQTAFRASLLWHITPQLEVERGIRKIRRPRHPQRQPDASAALAS